MTIAGGHHQLVSDAGNVSHSPGHRHLVCLREDQGRNILLEEEFIRVSPQTGVVTVLLSVERTDLCQHNLISSIVIN